MPTPPLGTRVLMDTAKAVLAVDAEKGYSIDGAGSSAIAEAARRLNMSSSTVRHRWNIAQDRLDIEGLKRPHSPTDDDGPLEDGLDVLQRHAEANAAYINKTPKKRHFVFPVKAEPFGIGFVGDPHLDNKGANIDAFLNDMDLFRAAGVRCVNMGDITDNFQARGKLAPKQAQNKMTIKEGHSVARWMVRDSGVNWDLHILGNHDLWLEDQGVTMLAEWAKSGRSRVADWMAGLEYAWGDGSFKVLAAHDFKGHSIHNSLHGNMRRALADGWADLYVSAHRHNAARADAENGFRKRHYHHLRVRGYKDVDDYSWTKGFEDQSAGRSALAVIDPNAPPEERCTKFLDLARGVDYLNFLRGRA